MVNITKEYKWAKECFAELGVDSDAALEKLRNTPLSVHCWQIDDLTGFEDLDRTLANGLAAIGNAPGKPRSKEEFMKNLTQGLKLIPGKNKLALHAVYLDAGGKQVDRDQIEPEHFSGWVDYAKDMKLGLDFNPTYMSHKNADDGFTLSSKDDHIRSFWVEHGRRCRKVGEYFGKSLGMTCVTNHWIPDGYKDVTVDKLGPRLRLADSLDKMFAEKIPEKYAVDSVESKLFGLGSESYVTGSHEFYSNYVANRKNCIICMDMGHFHPTETVSSKLTSYWAFDQKVMLHISRPVRWDSDHVVIVDDETKSVMQEVVRADAFDKTYLGTDYFDASINRIAATVLGARSIKKALLYALLEPTDTLKKAEQKDDFTKRLVLLEEYKCLPFEVVWAMFCEQENVPNANWLSEIDYEV